MEEFTISRQKPKQIRGLSIVYGDKVIRKILGKFMIIFKLKLTLEST